jgi:ferritin-like metal-binding protein YciE
MEHNELKELYIDELRDLYDAENKLVKALAKLAKAASSDRLRAGSKSTWSRRKDTSRALRKSLRLWTKSPPARNALGWLA